MRLQHVRVIFCRLALLFLALGGARTEYAAQLVWDPTVQGPGLPVVGKYTVYYTATDLPLQQQSVGLNTFFALDFLPAGKTYTLYVTATSVEGAESDRSGTVPYTPSLGAAPAIVTAPVSQTAIVGQSVSLSVFATGLAPLTYQWLKGGSLISGATSATFTIASSQISDAGSYTVRVSNSIGSVISAPATITILVRPSITSQPSSQTVTAGATATLTVSATGSAPLTYQWFKNGAIIAGATSASLTLSNVQAGDNGLYTVAVSNAAGSATSSGATLTVVTPPAITAQPQGQSLNAGSTISLSVTATGTAPLAYQWLKFGVNIPGATASTLSIAAATANDAGTYSVRVSNAAGSVTSSGAVVTVIVAPSITAQPASQTLNAGATISLAVTATGSTPLTYQWRKDGANIAGATAATFTKASAIGTDSASYTVRISNSAGNVTSSAATVTVNTPPTITVQPASQSVNFGQPLTLSVQANGSQPLTYRWKKDGVVIASATSATYQVASTDTTHAGIYVAEVSNVAGTVTSSQATVAVFLPNAPVITTQPQSATLAVGSPLNLSVVASGTGPFTYQWLKNGSPIGGATSSAYSVGSAQSTDSGSYVVRVSNAGGNTLSATATITVGAAPSISVQPVSQSINAGLNAQFSVQAGGSAPLTYQWFRAGVAIPGATASTLTVSQITSADAGAYQVQVSNSLGTATSQVANLTVTGAPVITAQPQGATIAYGGTLSLSVQVTGVTPLTYRWFKSGTVIANAAGATYQVSNVDQTHSGDYSVEISNGAGRVTSQTVTITVQAPVAPSITTQPVSVNLEPGGTMNLSVVATGTTPLSYQWLKNDVLIVGATSATFQIVSVQPTNAGSYKVRVSNLAGNQLSDAAILTVGTAPTISTQPVSRTLAAGASVTFSVAANGSTPLSYRWKKSGVVISGATSSSYSIASIVAGDAGNYTVDVSNFAGSVTSQSATLTVLIPPAITTQPVSQSIDVGRPATFFVEASGTGPLQYQWMRNGNNIAVATSATYQIAAVTLADQANYTVKVTGPGGNVTSQSASLTVTGAPTIVTSPQSQTLSVGSALTLTVQASGATPLAYQWKKGGANISGATSATFSIASVQTSDTGSYTVTVSNGAGSATSAAATITALTPPQISAPPQNLTVNLGASATFTVTATGSAPLSYQWLKFGTAIPGAISATFSIPTTTAGDAGSYSVRVSNQVGSVTSSGAQLTVITPPAITTQPVGQTLNAGATLTLSVVASGSLPLNYQWTRNNADIPGATAAQYVKQSVQGTDGGNYAVRVSNPAGTVTSTSVSVTVITPPTITTDPASQTVNFGSALNLNVIATGTQPFTYRWSKDGTTIATATAASYQVPSAGTVDSGIYVVIVSNAAGSATSKPAAITIALPDAPTINTQPQSTTVTVGSPINLSVQASGAGTLSYQWLKDGSPIAGATSATYVVASAQTSHAGTYNVRVSNAGGTTLSASAVVTVGVPPAITQQPASQSALAGTTAEFSVVVTGSAPLAFQWFRNGTILAGATSSTLQIPNVKASDAGSFVVEISNNAGRVTSTPATLTVTGTPVITTQPVSQNVPYGNSFSLTVTATGAQPMAYRWIKDGAFIAGAISATYQIASADLTHSGSYSVEISNGAGTVVSQSATITVGQPPAPTITQQPASVNPEPGTSVTLTVQATGPGTLTYQWFKNQSAVVGATSSSFQIASVQASDAGVYTVQISNIGGSALSQPATLKVGTAPTIVTQPADQTVEAGNPVTLSVEAAGTAPLTYRWLKAGVAISGATSSAFTILQVASTDAGDYSVEISNIAGTITSQPAVLSVTIAPKPPVITAQPISRSVDVRGSTTFFVEATGSGALAYEWVHDGLTITGATNASLQIASIGIADGGVYLVRVSNEAGSTVSDPATLTVTGQPVVVRSPQSQSISTNTPLLLSVDVSGVAPFTYRWIKNGSYIANATSATFQIASVELTDAGSYSVEVSNAAGSALSEPAVVQVTATAVGNQNPNGTAPTITRHPIAQSVEAGSSATFSVEATGTAPLAYTWIHNGSIVPGATNAIYTIPATALGDAGTYSVEVRNAAGFALSEAANLSVIGAPVIRVNPQSQTLAVGSALALSVDAGGATPLTYRWTKGGAFIPGGTNSNYLIAGVQLSDAGNYGVQVSNAAGQAVSQTATIAVNQSGPIDPTQPVAPTFTRQPESQSIKSGRAVTFAVEVTGTAPLSYSWSKNGIVIAGANSASFTISAVKISDAGTYNVTVSNSAGRITSSGATLTVTGSPKITGHPRSQTVDTGAALSLFVDVTGAEPLTYQWLKDNVYLSSATNATLVIPSAQSTDSGSYSVEVDNDAGSVLSDPAVVTVVAGSTNPPGSTVIAPTIMRDPLSQSVAVGKSATLSVEAFGSLPMSYRWLRNGAYLANETSPVLTIATAGINSAGSYSVEISNAAGSILSRSATITLSGAPVIVRHPQSQSVITNTPILLSVGVQGSAPMTYRWIKGGAYIPGATNANFIVQSAQFSDAGSYSVQIQNALDDVVSLPASITVVPMDPVTPQRPRIIAHPVSQSVDASADLTLAVQAFSLDPMTYRWLKNGAFIPGASASTLAISAARSSDAGSYSVEVRNSVGAVVSESAIIQIVGEPAILSQPQSQGLFIGSRLDLVVSYTGAEPLSFRWTKDGAYIANATNRALSIATVQLTDSGSYGVEISNHAGQAVSQPAIVRVLESNGASSGGGLAVPTILQHPTDQLTDVGEETIFSVTATSASPLTYAWIHNGAFIPGATSSILRIASTQLSDGGGYAVQVSSTNAALVSRSATLEVTGAPSIFFPPEGGEVLAGSTLYLSVYVIGAEPLQYKWVKNGAFIPGATNSFLSVPGAQKTDGGTYWVQVSNPAGQAISSSAIITVGGEPVIVKSPQSQSVLLNSPFDLTVQVSGGAPFNYQWIKNGAIIVGATNSVLSFASIKFTDAGSYTVQVSNGAGSAVSQPAQITVTGAPVIRTQPIAQTIAVGSTLTLTVEADGVAPFTYRWIKGGAVIPDATSQTYTVAAAQTSHSGQYSVEVSNPVGKTNSVAVQVTVTALPIILQQPASQTVGVGSPITLNVEVGGAGPFTFAWKKNGVAIPGAISKTLVFASAQLTNAGSYVVEVRNNAPGLTSSQPATVTVTDGTPPELTLEIRTTLTGSAEIVLTAPAGQYAVESTPALVPATWTTIFTTNTTGARSTLGIPIGAEQKKFLRVRTGN